MEPPGELRASLGNFGGAQQLVEHAGHGRALVVLWPNRAADTQALEPSGVVGLVVREGDHQLRDTGRERLRQGADAAVMHECRRARRTWLNGTKSK